MIENTRPWLRHYDGNVPHSLDYPALPVDELLTRASAHQPDHAATRFGALIGPRLFDATLSYRELEALVNRFAAGLQQYGVGPGDRVAVMCPNCPQFVIACLAIWRIGATVVCCNPLYVEREIHHLFCDAGCETVVVLSSLYQRVKAVRTDSQIRRVIVVDIKNFFPPLVRLLFGLTREKKEGHRIDIKHDADTYRFEELLDGDTLAPQPTTINPEAVAVLVYTGGTTGAPKGVQLTHRNLLATAQHLNVWVNAQEAGEVLIAVMPFFHAYGLSVGMVAGLYRASTMILIPDPRDLKLVLRSIEKRRATFYPGVPTMFTAFNSYGGQDDYDLSSLRMAACAAAPLPPEVQAKFEQITGGKMVEAYGLSEAVSAVTVDPVGRPRAHTIGVPLPDTDVRIVDMKSGDRELPQGEIGEIIVKGPQVMAGYWQKPEATAATLRTGPDNQTGWLYTGDTGFMDEEGYFHIADRKKDMIIAGGYNIYPANIEAVLYEHPKVKEAAVIGVPHDRRGETVKAFVVLHEGETCNEQEIITFCRERMAVYKAPRMVEFRSELPKSPVGKILRRALREESQPPATADK